MNNPFDEIRDAINIAKETKEACRNHVNAMVDLLDGNLESVSCYRLNKLKEQLRRYNMHTGRWKK